MNNIFIITLIDSFTSVESFLDSGGDVLYAIMAVAFLMWVLLIERVFFVLFSFNFIKNATFSKFKNSNQNPLKRENYKKMLISKAHIKLNKYVQMIKSLIAICPMLGLLGTVSGMIEVFDVVSMVGTGNAKAMSEGVSKATIPTMSGMVVGISGIFFLFWYQRKAQKEENLIKEKLEAM